MDKILLGGMLAALLFLAGVSLAHQNAGRVVYYQNTCSQSDAVACIMHGQRIPNN